MRFKISAAPGSHCLAQRAELFFPPKRGGPRLVNYYFAEQVAEQSYISP
jgi:hypothetical protein